MVHHNIYFCVFLYDFDFCLQFDKDEVQGLFNIGTESWAVLIWSYKCIPGAKYIGRPPDHFNVIDLPEMPVLDLQSSACSCTGNPQNTRIQNFTNLTYVESNSEDDGDQHDGEANDAGDELYTTTFPIKGSTYNDIYQENLKTVQRALRLKTPMTIQLEQEPDNPKDSNAILVKVCVDDLFLIIGYIGVKKLPKVVSAIRLQEIVDIKVKSVTTWLVRNLNIRKLRCYIQMCKKNKWLPDNELNTYNSNL